MRVPLALLFVLFCGSVALAQASPPSNHDQNDKRGVEQPQGSTGPLNTTSGGNPPENPEGDTPPGMQTDPRVPNPK